jgi:hypothetical protein
VLSHLGDTHLATSNYEAARIVLRQSLAILDRLGHPNADNVHAKLARAHTPLTAGTPQ